MHTTHTRIHTQAIIYSPAIDNGSRLAFALLEHFGWLAPNESNGEPLNSQNIPHKPVNFWYLCNYARLYQFDITTHHKVGLIQIFLEIICYIYE